MFNVRIIQNGISSSGNGPQGPPGEQGNAGVRGRAFIQYTHAGESSLASPLRTSINSASGSLFDSIGGLQVGDLLWLVSTSSSLSEIFILGEESDSKIGNLPLPT